jgi:hypothetical protein
MTKYEISYTSWVTIEVEAHDEDQALSMGDAILDTMTGADFRECCDYGGIREVGNCKYCGGNCPNDESHACDGYLGDIDNLYKEAA